jgi:hypothetical protein
MRSVDLGRMAQLGERRATFCERGVDLGRAVAAVARGPGRWGARCEAALAKQRRGAQERAPPGLAGSGRFRAAGGPRQAHEAHAELEDLRRGRDWIR